MPSGPWTSLCSACVLELAAPRQCGEEATGPLCALGEFAETPRPAVLAGGKGRQPMQRHLYAYRKQGSRKHPPPPCRGTKRSRLFAASPSARPGAAARPPRGLCSSSPCSAPGGFPGAPRWCMRGNGSRRSRLGGGALSRRGLFWGGKNRVEDGSTTKG